MEGITEISVESGQKDARGGISGRFVIGNVSQSVVFVSTPGRVSRGGRISVFVKSELVPNAPSYGEDKDCPSGNCV